MVLWLILAFLSAILETIAVSRNLQNLEYLAKPAVMMFLFLWLYTKTGLRGDSLWFGIGILSSLAGDVLLMFPTDRFFIAGLIAFLLAHLSYITAFRNELMTFNVWSVFLIVVLTIVAGRMLGRIVRAMKTRGEGGLAAPVIVYGIVICIMACAAMSTLRDPTWKAAAAVLVSAGAFSFVASDGILAWMKFVSTIKHGRVLNMLLYHFGQIALIAGAISQFG